MCAAVTGLGSWPLGSRQDQERAILEARERSNWGPMRLTFLTGSHRSTIWKVLHRHGVSRRRCRGRPPKTRRYEWAEPVAGDEHPSPRVR